MQNIYNTNWLIMCEHPPILGVNNMMELIIFQIKEWSYPKILEIVHMYIYVMWLTKYLSTRSISDQQTPSLFSWKINVICAPKNPSDLKESDHHYSKLKHGTKTNPRKKKSLFKMKTYNKMLVEVLTFKFKSLFHRTRKKNKIKKKNLIVIFAALTLKFDDQ